jgi:hypothetical protein
MYLAESDFGKLIPLVAFTTNPEWSGGGSNDKSAENPRFQWPPRLCLRKE